MSVLYFGWTLLRVVLHRRLDRQSAVIGASAFVTRKSSRCMRIAAKARGPGIIFEMEPFGLTSPTSTHVSMKNPNSCLRTVTIDCGASRPTSKTCVTWQKLAPRKHHASQIRLLFSGDKPHSIRNGFEKTFQGER